MLENDVVRLEPLAFHHAEALVRAAADERIWQMTQPRIETLDDAQHYIQQALAAHDQQAYAIYSKQHDKIVGSTRFYDIDTTFGSAEIGYTWLHPDAWRTGVNTNMKYLMLLEAFEHQQVRRIQISTDARNERSRRAIERLGATFEGVLRQHKFGVDGLPRDTAMYSIIDQEWPRVKEQLQQKP